MPRTPAIFTIAASLLFISVFANARPLDYQSGEEPPPSWEMYRQQQVERQLENQRQLMEIRRRQLEMQQQQLELQRQQLEIQRQQQQRESEKQTIERKK